MIRNKYQTSEIPRDNDCSNGTNHDKLDPVLNIQAPSIVKATTGSQLLQDGEQTHFDKR